MRSVAAGDDLLAGVVPQDAWDVEQLLAVPERGALVAEIEAVLSALSEDARRLWARIRSGARA